MATWVWTGTGTAPSATDSGAPITGSIPLSKGTTPADWDPAGVTSVRIQWRLSITGTLNDDTWHDHQQAELNTPGGIAASVDVGSAPNRSAIGDYDKDATDNSPNTGLTTANWEAATLDPTDLPQTGWADVNKSKGWDGSTGTMTVSAVTVTITYTPDLDQTLSGVLFSAAPTFIAGVISTAYDLIGVLFSAAPAFVSGNLNATYTLDGVLLSKPPAFTAGTITTSYTIDGALFSAPPSFISGAVQADQQIDGVLFSKPPTFTAGAVIPNQQIDGVLFEKGPAFTPGSILPTANVHVDGDATGSNVVNELNNTTNLYASIDDDPGSPNDTDWVNNRTTELSGPSQFFTLENMPSGFDSADSVSVTVRHRGQEFSGPVVNVVLNVRIYKADETTPLTNSVQAAVETSNSSWTNTTVQLTGVVGATKADWDGARLLLEWGSP